MEALSTSSVAADYCALNLEAEARLGGSQVSRAETGSVLAMEFT